MDHLFFTIKVSLNQPNIEDVYNKTIKWIKKKYQSKITYTKEFDLIQVKYGRHSRMYYDYVEITFRFWKEEDVKVEVSLNEKYISDAEENDLRGHKYYIENYLEFMGVTLTNELLRKLYTIEDLKFNLKGTIIGLIALNTIFVFMFFLFYRLVFKYTDIPLFFLSLYLLILNLLVELRAKAIRGYFIDKERKRIIYG
jgi:hypothetical protein